MAATCELNSDSLLSGFDQIYEVRLCEKFFQFSNRLHIHKDFKRRIEEIQFLKSNWNSEIKRREALEITCDSLEQDNGRLTKLYTESLNNLAEQVENRAKCQRLKEELQRRNDEYRSREEEYRKAMELFKKEHVQEVGLLEAKVRGLLLEKATNEETISQLQKNLATHKGHVQMLSKRLDQLHSDEESKYLLEILDLKDCLLVEQEEKNELTKKLQDVEKELLITRTKLVEQQQDSASSRQVETLKLKIMKLRKENEILKRKLSSVDEC